MNKKQIIAISSILIALIAILIIVVFSFPRFFNKINPFSLPEISFSKEVYSANVFSDVTLPTPNFSKKFSKETSLKLSVKNPNGKETDIINDSFYADMSGYYEYFVTLESGEKKSVGKTKININDKLPATMTLRKFSDVVVFGKYAQFPTLVVHENTNFKVIPKFEIEHESTGKRENVIDHGFIPSLSGVYNVTVSVDNGVEITKKVIKYFVRKENEFESADIEEYIGSWVAQNGGNLEFTNKKNKNGEGAFYFWANASNTITWPSFKMINMPTATMEKIKSVSFWVYNDSGYDIPLYESHDPIGNKCGVAASGKWTKISIKKEDFPKYFIPQGKIDSFGFYLIHKGSDVKLYFDEFRFEFNEINFAYEDNYDSHIVGTAYGYPKVNVTGVSKIISTIFNIYDEKGKIVASSPNKFIPSEVGVYKVECVASTDLDDYVDTFELAVMKGADNDNFKPLSFLNGISKLINISPDGLTSGSYKSLKLVFPQTGYPTIKVNMDMNEYIGIKVNIKPFFTDINQKGKLGEIDFINMITGVSLTKIKIDQWNEVIIPFSAMSNNEFGLAMEQIKIKNPNITMYFDDIEYIKKQPMEDIDNNPDKDSPMFYKGSGGIVVSENRDRTFLFNENSSRSVKVSVSGEGYPTINFSPGDIYLSAKIKAKVINVRDRAGNPINLGTIKISNMASGADIYSLKQNLWTEIQITLINGKFNFGFLQDRPPLQNILFDVYFDDVKLEERQDKNKYIVKFYVENEIIKTQTAYGGTDIEPPHNPVKDFYIFKGYYDAKEDGKLVLSGDGASFKIHSNMNLYARFEKMPNSILSIPQLTKPIWESNSVICESVIFTEINKAKLFYGNGVKIISVVDSTLGNKYVEGNDYTYTSAGEITRISTGKIKQTTQSFLDGANGWGDAKELLINDVYVTYEHTDKWDDSTVPEYKGGQLTKTINKLNNKQPVKILFTGDSITNGGDSSYAHNIKPYQPTWNLMVVENLKQSYGFNNIKGVTKAYSGANSAQALFDQWGNYTPKQDIIDAAANDTDLIVIAYGMNDGATNYISASNTVDNINQIVALVRKKNPNVEVLVVSPMLPKSSKMDDTIHRQYPSAFKAAFDKSGSAVADVTTVHLKLLEKKDYYSMSGNGINHPNDFLIRLYAQTICATLVDGFKLGPVELPVFPDAPPSIIDSIATTLMTVTENTEKVGLSPLNTSGVSVKVFSPWNQYQTLYFDIDKTKYSAVKAKIKLGEVTYGAVSQFAFWNIHSGALIATAGTDGWYEITIPACYVDGKFELGMIKDGYRTPNLAGTEFYFYIDDIVFIEKKASPIDNIIASNLTVEENTNEEGIYETNKTGVSVKVISPWLSYQQLAFNIDKSKYKEVKLKIKFGGATQGIVSQLAFWNPHSGAVITAVPIDGWYEVTVPPCYNDGNFELGIIKDGYRTPNLSGAEFYFYIDDLVFVEK